MPPVAQWPLEHYRPLLRLQARGLFLGARLLKRYDESDLVQEAMARAQAGLARFRGTTEPELVAWLQAALASALRDLSRRERAGKRDVRRELALDAAVGESSIRWNRYLADDRDPPGAAAERDERAVRVAGAIGRLDPDQRDAILLREMQGLPVAEIAARMGRTVKAVAGLLLRGRQNLRTLLADLAE
jgi:RNA polymerase sigma-70 factor (ECF subfamily)